MTTKCHENTGKDAQKILKSDYDLAYAPRTPIKRTRVGKSDKAKERTALIKECDALTKMLLISERGATCEKCGKTAEQEPIYSCHIKAKGHYQRLRFFRDNLLLMCYRDHIEWAHKEPDNFIQWIEQKWPGRLQLLREMAAISAKTDLKQLTICLREELKLLTDGATVEHSGAK